jgi:hypothetical protein
MRMTTAAHDSGRQPRLWQPLTLQICRRITGEVVGQRVVNFTRHAVARAHWYRADTFSQIPTEANITRFLTFLCLGCGGNLAFAATGQIHQAFSLWADQDATLANFVGEPLPWLELESLAHGGWNIWPRSVIVDFSNFITL